MLAEATMDIQPIETSYKGYRFRSRLEARWAVFFDALELKWDYELEGFTDGNIKYLPDFFIHDIDAWIEIKGQEPTNAEQYKIAMVASKTEKKAFIFWGSIRIPDGTFYGPAYLFGPDKLLKPGERAYYWDNDYLWCQCPNCKTLGIQYGGRAARLKCGCGYYPPNDDHGFSWDTPDLVAAYNAALSARFEHGETGINHHVQY